MPPRNKVLTIDKGFNGLMRRILRKPPRLSVGIHEDEAAAETPSGTTVGLVASVHEFGSDTVPQRSFLRGWVDENRNEILRVLRDAERAVLRGGISQKMALGRVGAWSVGQIQARIAKRIAPVLADSTIARKGSDVPLIDTGQLRGSITWKLNDD